MLSAQEARLPCRELAELGPRAERGRSRRRLSIYFLRAHRAPCWPQGALFLLEWTSAHLPFSSSAERPNGWWATELGDDREIGEEPPG